MEETETKTISSAANSAYSQIFRIDEIKKRLHTHSEHSNHFAWNLVLDNLWRELCVDLPQKFPLKKEEVKKYYDRMNEINKKLLKTFPLISGNYSNGFNKIPKDRLNQISLQYLILNEKEIFLGELQNELGKGTKWDKGDEDDID